MLTTGKESRRLALVLRQICIVSIRTCAFVAEAHCITDGTTVVILSTETGKNYNNTRSVIKIRETKMFIGNQKEEEQHESLTNQIIFYHNSSNVL